ncbi:sulfurtransferase [Bacillus sp. Bva_UNVM-123]|uniref:sulfurtransferase n=1 Tax=Bacillus sp. Bva_UNVM-123 TaxID=2829798 RepID=UPI00391FAB55
MNLVVDIQWLHDHLKDENIRIVDCRYNLGDSEEGNSLYLQDHIPGAVYFHLSKDLASPVSTHGGRHPLPELEQFKQTLQSAGIHKDTIVIAYDGGEGSYATRLWWLLNYVGHEKTFVLNGGYKAWKEACYPVNSEVPTYEVTEFELKKNEAIFASIEDVKKIVLDKNNKTILIDSRDKNRYLGIEEAIDKKAGHIPGAMNKVWTEGYENGYFKTSEQQEKRFTDIDKNKEIIVYCGSGVTATPNFMALKSAGYQRIKLYAGSFSDWISYDENEIETGE